MSALDEKVSRLDEKVSDLKQKVTKVQVHLENDVSKKEMIRMNDNELLQKILADLQGIKAEQLKMKEELQTFRAETREELSRINKMLNGNFETTQAELVKAVKKEQKHSAGVDQKIADLEAVAAQNAHDVQLLKRRA